MKKNGEQRTRLHRIATVRRRTGVSQRAVARQLGISEHRLRRAESESTDIWLSELHGLSGVLGVPVEELLVRTADCPITVDVDRSGLSAVERTIEEMMDVVATARERNFVEMLLEQIREIRLGDQETTQC